MKLVLELKKLKTSLFLLMPSCKSLSPISSKEFLESIKSKAILLGRSINKKYGEGFDYQLRAKQYEIKLIQNCL